LKADFFSSEKEGTPITKKNKRDLTTTKWDSLASDERRNRKQSSRRRRE
jgi:hypothetical protein